MATATAWEEYVANLPPSHATSLNVDCVRRRLEDPDGPFFSDDDDDINVRITDLGDAGATCRAYSDGNSLWTAINNDPPYRTRMQIISIYSERTIYPLQITSDLLCKILRKYDVHPDFFRVVLSFGEEPHLAEASSGNLAIHPLGADRTDISYQINYVEENLRKGQDPWSFRHTGVYHRHSPDLDLFILLHPNQYSVIEARLFQRLGIAPEPTSYQILPNWNFNDQEPYRLHLLVLSSFFDNWRWYFRYLGDQFSDENNQAMIVKPEDADAKSTFQRVQKLRNMNDFALFAKACCNCNLKVVESLESSAATPLQHSYDLAAQMTTLRGYVESSDVLECRIRNAIDLVGYTLTLHNHLETATVNKELRDITHDMRNISEKMKNLTQDTVDDSATVKIITYVSAFYLPGSFATSLYGMNFFVFDAESRGLAMGANFWVFVATWLPLTGITVLIYILTLWLDARRKGKSWFRWQVRQPLPPKIE